MILLLVYLYFYLENEGSYDNFSSLAKRFVNQATNYLAFVGQNIENQIIKGVTFCFSTKPPQEIIEELQKIGVTVNWIQ